MRIVPHGEVSPSQWNEAVAGSSEAWCFHRHEWVALESKLEGVAGHAFALVDAKDRPLALLPLYVQTLALGPFAETLLHCGVHRHTGPAVRDDVPGPAAAAARRELMACVDRLAARAGADRIQLNAHNLAPAFRAPNRNEIPFWILDDGYELGVGMGPMGLRPAPGVSTLHADQVVQLAGRNRDDLFAGLDGACRRAVRKAQKHGLEFELLDRPDPKSGASRYLSLAKRSAERTGEALSPDDYYEGVLSQPDAVPRLAFARHEGRDVAALLVLVYKRGVHFLAGCSDPGALSVRPNDFIHWSLIEWAGREGHEAYRLGPAFPELPRDWPVAKVTRFKTKLGGTPVPILQGSRFLRPERYLPLAAQHARALAGADEEAQPVAEHASIWTRVARRLRTGGARAGGA